MCSATTHIMPINRTAASKLAVPSGHSPTAAGYPFIQTGDIRNAEHFITEYSQTYSEAGLAQSKLWPKGTICITIAANIAETGILDFDACFPDSVIGMAANPKEANVGFVEYLGSSRNRVGDFGGF